MFVFDLVDEVVLEGLDDEVFVIHEEDILGDGDGVIAVVDGGGGVEKLESFVVALVLGGRIFDKGILKEAVERAGADDCLSVVADACDRFENVLDGVAFHRRDADEGGVVEEEEFVAEVFFGRFNACGFLPFRVIKVELVRDDEAGLFFLLDEAGDFAVLGGDAGGEVDDEEADVGTADGAFAAHCGEDLDGVLHAGAFAKAGGVDDVVTFLAPDIRDIDSVSRGAGDFGDHGALVLEDGVDEGRLAGIGFADDGDFEPDGEVVVIDRGLFLGFEFGEFFVDAVEEVAHPASMFGGGGDAVAEAEAGEVSGGVIVVRAIGLVHDKDDVGIGLAKKLANFFIDGVDAGAGINDEDDQVGRVHSNAGFQSDLVGEAVLIEGADAAGIDEFARILGEGAGCGDAIAGDAGLIMHDGDASSGQTIKEGGFSDVGASNDGDLEGTGGHSRCCLRWETRKSKD